MPARGEHWECFRGSANVCNPTSGRAQAHDGTECCHAVVLISLNVHTMCWRGDDVDAIVHDTGIGAEASYLSGHRLKTVSFVTSQVADSAQG